MKKYVLKEAEVPILCCDNCEKEIENPPIKLVLKLQSLGWGRFYDFGEWVFCSVDCFSNFIENSKAKSIFNMVEREKKVGNEIKAYIYFENPEDIKTMLEKIFE